MASQQETWLNVKWGAYDRMKCLVSGTRAPTQIEHDIEGEMENVVKTRPQNTFQIISITKSNFSFE